MADASLVAPIAAVAGAAIGGAFGLLGARLQAGVAREHARLTQRQIEAETERLSEQRAAEDARQREAAYQAYLDHERFAAARLTTQIDPFSDKGYLQWLDGYNARYNTLLLIAPGDVREAAGRVDAVYRALFETQMALGPEAPFQERLISAYVQHRDDVAAAREQLVARVQASR